MSGRKKKQTIHCSFSADPTRELSILFFWKKLKGIVPRQNDKDHRRWSAAVFTTTLIWAQMSVSRRGGKKSVLWTKRKQQKWATKRWWRTCASNQKHKKLWILKKRQLEFVHFALKTCESFGFFRWQILSRRPVKQASWLNYKSWTPLLKEKKKFLQ